MDGGELVSRVTPTARTPLDAERCPPLWILLL
jgi:hypothetical protein